MTKAEERATLAKIKKLIDSTGEESYVSSAFSGCIELAERNIDNDWLESYPDMLARVTESRDQLSRSWVAASNENERLEALVEQLEKERDDLAAELAKRTIPKYLYQWLFCFFDDEERKQTMLMEGYADTMADLADTPNDIAFASAVEQYRKSKERREWCQQIMNAVEYITPDEFK